MKKKYQIIIFIIISSFIFTSCNSEKYSNIIFKSTNENYGDTGGINLPISVSNEEISILVESEYSDLSDKVAIKELGERTGLNINVISVSGNSIYDKVKVLLSSDALPDIMRFPFSLKEINAFGMKGTFVPINKYLYELPNFRRVFLEDDLYSNIYEFLTAEDGNIYNFPKYECKREVEEGMFYRKDIFLKHDIPLWDSPETFYKALKRLKEIYPDSSPYVSRQGRKIFDQWSLSFGIDFPYMNYDKEKGLWSYSGADIKFKEMLDFIRKLYEEKLLDENFLKTDENAWKAKIMSDEKAFVTYDDIKYMDAFSSEMQKKNKLYDLQFAPNPGSYKLTKNNKVIEVGPVITNTDNKLISMKLLDYLLSPSGSELMTLGVRNKTFNYDDHGNVNYLGFNKNEIVTKNMVEERYGLFVEGLYQTLDKRSPYFTYSKREQKALSYVNSLDRVYDEKYKVSLTRKDVERAYDIIEDLKERSYQFAVSYITSSSNKDISFDEYVKNLNLYGLSELTEIYNKN